jgi:hypothetical protein
MPVVDENSWGKAVKQGGILYLCTNLQRMDWEQTDPGQPGESTGFEVYDMITKMIKKWASTSCGRHDAKRKSEACVQHHRRTWRRRYCVRVPVHGRDHVVTGKM